MGAFRVGRRIGGGGMGVVFEAYDEGLARRVALKVISPHLADDPAFRARFTREAQAQASLDSAHVVHVYAHGEADGRLYIATQLVPDGDLGMMVRAHGGAPLRTAVDLIAQVASGLADAHAAGLIHRDIKPANVLLRRRDSGLHAYLGDFGIAREIGADQTLTAAGTVGTPSYMAPELHTGGCRRGGQRRVLPGLPALGDPQRAGAVRRHVGLPGRHRAPRAAGAAAGRLVAAGDRREPRPADRDGQGPR
nr:serine/threonine-protein kinase [Nocardioides luti]